MPTLSRALLPCLLVCLAAPLSSQTKTGSPAGAVDAAKATKLAESGHCKEALPMLKRAIRQASDRALKKRIGLDGLHCAMTHDVPYESLAFLDVLSREFPRDPEVLYAATHAYSDLSIRAAQDLGREAPFSYQVHALNAEALETQGRWDQAAAEYRKILEMNPMLPGIHARLGRALLSTPQPTAEAVEQARKNFERELEIDPSNAGAEYVLGQLAANEKDWASAARHFSRATALDDSFSEAYLGLGESLVSAKRFSEAISPLERYEQLAPDSPSGHYQLALAYAGVGRRDDANREAALQRQTAETLEQAKRRMAEGFEQKQQPASPEAPASESPK